MICNFLIFRGIMEITSPCSVKGQSYVSTDDMAIDGFSEEEFEVIPDLTSEKDQPYLDVLAEELEPFLEPCPLSLVELRDPVVDRCGHVFEMSKIESWAKTQKKNRPDLPEGKYSCPVSRRWMNLRDLYPCQMIKEAAANVRKLEEEGEKNPSKSKEVKIPRNEWEEFRAQFAEQRGQIDKQTKQNDKCIGMLCELAETNTWLVKKMEVQNVQIKNIMEMTVCDKVKNIFGFVSTEDILSRDLTKSQIEILTQTAPPKESDHDLQPIVDEDDLLSPPPKISSSLSTKEKDSIVLPVKKKLSAFERSEKMMSLAFGSFGRRI
jgi:hypothetical protein